MEADGVTRQRRPDIPCIKNVDLGDTVLLPGDDEVLRPRVVVGVGDEGVLAQFGYDGDRESFFVSYDSARVHKPNGVYLAGREAWKSCWQATRSLILS